MANNTSCLLFLLASLSLYGCAVDDASIADRAVTVLQSITTVTEGDGVPLLEVSSQRSEFLAGTVLVSRNAFRDIVVVSGVESGAVSSNDLYHFEYYIPSVRVRADEQHDLEVLLHFWRWGPPWSSRSRWALIRISNDDASNYHVVRIERRPRELLDHLTDSSVRQLLVLESLE